LSILLYLGTLYQFALPVSAENEIRGVDPDSLGQMNSTDSTIPNQYVVSLRDDTSGSAMQSLIDEVQNKGAQIIGIYDQSFTGFSFVTHDAKIAEEIVNFLGDNPQVESVIPDRELSIQ
jgi:malate/lactate dehydrogenase